MSNFAKGERDGAGPSSGTQGLPTSMTTPKKSIDRVSVDSTRSRSKSPLTATTGRDSRTEKTPGLGPSAWSEPSARASANARGGAVARSEPMLLQLSSQSQSQSSTFSSSSKSPAIRSAAMLPSLSSGPGPGSLNASSIGFEDESGTGTGAGTVKGMGWDNDKRAGRPKIGPSIRSFFKKKRERSASPPPLPPKSTLTSTPVSAPEAGRTQSSTPTPVATRDTHVYDSSHYGGLPLLPLDLGLGLGLSSSLESASGTSGSTSTPGDLSSMSIEEWSRSLFNS